MIRGIPDVNGQYSGSSREWFEPLPVLCGVGLMFGYGLLGASWLVLRSTDLRDWAYRRIPWLAGGMLAFVAIAFAGTLWQAREYSHQPV
jgi:cytochrome bd ubiquinol oxidase subunit II